MEQTVNFFSQKSVEKDGAILESLLNQPEENEELWNNIQNDTVWENVLEYTYSLSNTNKDHQSCVDVYTKQRRKKNKKMATNSSSINKNCSSSSKSLASEKMLANVVNINYCNVVKCKHDGSSTVCLKNKQLFGKARGELSDTLQNPKENFQKLETFDCHTDYKADEIDETLCQELNGKLNENGRQKLSSNSLSDNQISTTENATTKPLSTNCDQPKSRKNCSKVNSSTNSDKHLVQIEVDEYQTNKMQWSPGQNWTADEDNQLVQLLIDPYGCNTTKTNSNVGG